MNTTVPPTARISRQFIRFVITGTCATSAHYLVLWLFLLTLLHPALGSAIGYLIGAVVGYLLNYYYTFGSKRTHARAVALFCLMVLIGFCINTSSVYLFVQLDISPWSAQLIATAITLCCNFLFAKLIVF